jgi:GTPase
MLTDEADVILIGGHGGAGKVSFGAKKYSGPDGGNGGRGGDVYITVSRELTLLNQFSAKTEISAENGQPGGRQKMTGKNGNDLEIILPIGTLITNKETKEEIELLDTTKRFLIAKGGLGGRGNFEFRSSRNTTPKYAQPGLPGEKKKLHLNLKLIADFGLIGLPNAGKSSLLNELTQAHVKVADYPFTTLEANLGVFNGRIIADIPGLIEGASQGKGLGIKFLKHIERVKLLLHCISAESQDVLLDYQTIQKELINYNKNLKAKKEIILITKSDLVSENILENLLNQFKKLKKKVLITSIHDLDSLKKLEAEILRDKS